MHNVAIASLGCFILIIFIVSFCVVFRLILFVMMLSFSNLLFKKRVFSCACAQRPQQCVVRDYVGLRLYQPRQTLPAGTEYTKPMKPALRMSCCSQKLFILKLLSHH
jgi:hypothetical protein